MNYKWIAQERCKNVFGKKSDSIDLLTALYSNAGLSRVSLLETKRKDMIECVKKYGQVWLNSNGSYSPPIRNFEIVD